MGRTGCDHVMEPQLTSIIINTGRAEAMLQFYGRLGLEFVKKQVSKGGECHKAFIGPVELTLYTVKATAGSRAPDMQLTFQINNLNDVVADLVKIADVQCLMDPTLLPDGNKAILLDPDGRAVELVER